MATSAVVQIGPSDEKFAFGMKRGGRVPARASAGVNSRGVVLKNRGGARYLPCFFYF